MTRTREENALDGMREELADKIGEELGFDPVLVDDGEEFDEFETTQPFQSAYDTDYVTVTGRAKRITLLFPWGPAQIIGGPYKERPQEFPGIKLAEEINMPYALSLPTRDFSTPDPALMETVLGATIAMMRAGVTPYAGCAWGQGRTGLFLGVLNRIADASVTRWWQRTPDPITRIRTIYRKEACETRDQEAFVRDFDIGFLVRLARNIA